jgi:pimeloyl-ACP methyl ester carboxylesterase
MIKHYFEISNNLNGLIKGDLRIPFLDIPASVVIFSHGFKGFRNWSFIPYISDKFAENGFISVNYDFSLNGIDDDEKQIYNDDIFRKNTVSTEINDLKTLITHLINYEGIFESLNNLWNGDIFLVGHSLGGAVSILTAPYFNQVKKISLWASVSKLDRNTQRQKDVWKEKGYTDIVINSTGQKLHLDFTYIEDKDNVLGVGAIMNTMRELPIPVQIIHPLIDMTVNIKEAYELKSTESDNRIRDLIVIERAGHIFNCRHPFKETNPALEKAFDSTLNFLKSEYV